MGGGVNVVATGGHLIPPDDLVLVGEDAVWLEGEQIVSRSTHGTGCAFSSALVSRLVLGDQGIDAARHAKGYVAEAIRRAEAMGRGLGPVKHLWPLLE
jgi:hydroxymethylpyrimidine/phosphomethylpyrimidine kinase